MTYERDSLRFSNDVVIRLRTLTRRNPLISSCILIGSFSTNTARISIRDGAVKFSSDIEVIAIPDEDANKRSLIRSMQEIAETLGVEFSGLQFDWSFLDAKKVELLPRYFRNWEARNYGQDIGRRPILDQLPVFDLGVVDDRELNEFFIWQSMKILAATATLERSRDTLAEIDVSGLAKCGLNLVKVLQVKNIEYWPTDLVRVQKVDDSWTLASKCGIESSVARQWYRIAYDKGGEKELADLISSVIRSWLQFLNIHIRCGSGVRPIHDVRTTRHWLEVLRLGPYGNIFAGPMNMLVDKMETKLNERLNSVESI